MNEYQVPAQKRTLEAVSGPLSLMRKFTQAANRPNKAKAT
jgi:hypothetical protein